MDGDKRPIPRNIVDEMREAMLAYAMSVIIGRALPDVRDGLKPVQRRVLFTMHELKNTWNSAFKKSARIVGDCIGKYHPHGDAAVYETLARMAQDFSLRYMLVDGQGNFGSVDGDPPAAMRYTEVRMAKITQWLLADLDKDTVDFAPTYDESMVEPTVLPTRIPNLLVNGTQGIAVGMATNIPPHNLGESIDASVALIDNPDLTLAELMRYIPGPDFPTGGIIYGNAGIKEAYSTGRGTISIRAVAEVETQSNHERIIITELPYQVNKAKLIEKIAELVHDKKVEGISELRDESDRHGMRIVIELRRDVQGQVILNHLFKLTPLQSSFGLNMVAIVHGEPRTLSLKEMLLAFVDHRKDVTLRRCRFELKKLREREHILEGFRIALDHLDEVISIIRSSKTVDEARETLCERFGLSEVQSQAILDMRLSRLTGMEREKVLDELAQVRSEIARLEAILGDEQLLLNLIKEELLAVKAEFNDPRRTQIMGAAIDMCDEDLIPMEDMVVTVSHEGYIKRVPVREYQAQRRGGRGKVGMSTKDDDFVEHLFVSSSHAHMLFFTNKGRAFSQRVFALPEGSRTARGKPIINLLNFESGEKLAMVLAVPEFVEGQYLLFVTKNGVVKKTDIMAYSSIRPSGIIAMLLREGDSLIAVRLTSGNSQIVLATAKGMAAHFDENDVRSMGRSAAGVKGMDVADDDQVVSCVTVEPEELEQAQLFTVCANGYGKRTLASQYRLTRRGAKGVTNIVVNERNGDVVGMVRVDSEDDQYLMVTDKGTIIRGRVSEVRSTNRVAQGVRLINVGEGEHVQSVARYVPGSDEDDPTDLEGVVGEPGSEVMNSVRRLADPDAALKVQALAEAELMRRDAGEDEDAVGDDDADADDADVDDDDGADQP